MDISIRLGHRFHMTFGALGKAIVSFQSESEREKILSKKNLYFYGDPSRMDKERLIEDIEQCRKRGFAEEIGDIRPGIHAVSAPVMGPRGIRINSVSPAPVVRNGAAPKGSGRVTPAMAAEAYVKCGEGNFTGQTVRVWNME